MQKRTKILLGVGALAVVGYLVWKNNQPKDIFASATGRGRGKGNLMTSNDVTDLIKLPDTDCTQQACGCSTKRELVKFPDGSDEFVYTCANGCKSFKTNKEGNCKDSKN